MLFDFDYADNGGSTGRILQKHIGEVYKNNRNGKHYLVHGITWISDLDLWGFLLQEVVDVDVKAPPICAVSQRQFFGCLHGTENESRFELSGVTLSECAHP